MLLQSVDVTDRCFDPTQNLLGKLCGFFNERMIESGLMKTLNNMRERKWADEDIVKGIQAVRDVLIREYKELK